MMLRISSNVHTHMTNVEPPKRVPTILIGKHVGCSTWVLFYFFIFFL